MGARPRPQRDMPRSLVGLSGEAFYRELGKGLAGTLRCRVCRTTSEVDEAQAGRGVRGGFPACHGEEMALTPRKEARR